MYFNLMFFLLYVIFFLLQFESVVSTKAFFNVFLHSCPSNMHLFGGYFPTLRQSNQLGNPPCVFQTRGVPPLLNKMHKDSWQSPYPVYPSLPRSTLLPAHVTLLHAALCIFQKRGLSHFLFSVVMPHKVEPKRYTH